MTENDLLTPHFSALTAPLRQEAAYLAMELFDEGSSLRIVLRLDPTGKFGGGPDINTELAALLTPIATYTDEFGCGVCVTWAVQVPVEMAKRIESGSPGAH